MTKNIKYKKKYVIFIDLLGFSDLVARPKKSGVCIKNKRCEEIYKILTDAVKCYEDSNFNDILLKKDGNGVLDISFENGDFLTGRIVGDCQITYCSDSVFITIDPKLISDDYYVQQYVSIIQFELLLKNLLIRGGISYGDVYHNQNIIYGPAVIEAIQIEKRMGNNPFIGASKKVQKMFDLQDDKIDFLEFYRLSWWGSEDVPADIKNILQQLSNQFLELEKKSLKNEDKKKIQEKLQSMKSYFFNKISETIKQINEQLIQMKNSKQIKTSSEEVLQEIKEKYQSILLRFY